jgi:hypothetical protein
MSFFGQWTVFNSVVVIGTISAVALVAVVVLLICIGTKRRLMSVRNNFIPILDQKVAKKQKKFITEEHNHEKNFKIGPSGGKNTCLHGWYEEGDRDMFSDQIFQFVEGEDYEEKELTEQRVPWFPESSRASEQHLGTLVAKSPRIIEDIAGLELVCIVFVCFNVSLVALDPQLARKKNQDVPSYLNSLMNSQRLDKKNCERYIWYYENARFGNAVQRCFSLTEFAKFQIIFKDLCRDLSPPMM